MKPLNSLVRDKLFARVLKKIGVACQKTNYPAQQACYLAEMTLRTRSNLSNFIYI